MKQIVIGLVGPMVSGKGEVAQYLKSLGFKKETVSDRIREELISRNRTVTRTSLQNVGNELRETFGPQILVERTLAKFTGDEPLVVIDGLRNSGEILFLKEHLNAVIIGIEAPLEMRFAWYLKRAAERGEEGATAEDFHRNNDRDSGIGEPAMGQQVNLCLSMSDYVLMNDSTPEILFNKLDLLLKQELAYDPEIHSRLREIK